MATDTTVHVRIDAQTKAQATAVLENMGLSVSDAVRLLLLRVADERRLPFENPKVPNAATRAAMAELERGEGKTFESVDALFEDLKS